MIDPKQNGTDGADTLSQSLTPEHQSKEAIEILPSESYLTTVLAHGAADEVFDVIKGDEHHGRTILADTVAKLPPERLAAFFYQLSKRIQRGGR